MELLQMHIHCRISNNNRGIQHLWYIFSFTFIYYTFLYTAEKRVSYTYCTIMKKGD